MRNKHKAIPILIVLLVVFFAASHVFAETAVPFSFGFNVGTTDNPKEVSSSIQILLLLTVLSLAPSILIMMTSFTRIIIVLSFLRNALGTQQMPPNQVLIGLALFLSLFIMSPVLTDINDNAYQPYSKGEITQEAAVQKSSDTIKSFMLKQFGKNEKDLEFFVKLAKIQTPVDPKTLPLTVVIPAFIINELTIAFKIGFLIYIPFLIIDMVVSSTLMSMGMMMLPPVMISLPFKILLFVMVDGWTLISQTLVNSFIT
ncbi:MAG: flagellar type III secretion system pore protein FliP [Clostridiales bacterium]|nr:flagellar type III secretion system pore protein FliP [Clostridiales bacterium]